MRLVMVPALVLAAALVSTSSAVASCGVPSVTVDQIPSQQFRITNNMAVNGAWAVWGSDADSAAPILEKYNGSSWTFQQTPVPPNSTSTTLDGVTTYSANDAWAVGYGNKYGPLVERWNGRTWSIVELPPKTNIVPFAVAVNPANENDVWVVGYGADHFNGRTWTEAALPHDKGAVGLLVHAISVGPSGHAWAVGEEDFYKKTLTWVAYWDGKEWVQSHDTVAQGALYGVTITPDGRVWVVGESIGTSGVTPVIERFVDGAWSQSNLPESGLEGQLVGVSSYGYNVWAVGGYSPFGSASIGIPLFLYWESGRWLDLPTESTVVFQQLVSVSALPASRAEAIGYAIDPINGQTEYAAQTVCNY